MLKRVASFLPASLQIELRRLNHRRQIAKGLFDSDEPEYRMLDTLVSPGDWCLDIGANIGAYTKRLSDIVGETGRVIAFEPIPEAFFLLSSNARCFNHDNVTLINAAASDCFGIASMAVPDSDNGLPNYCEASITGNGDGLHIITMSIDSLGIDHRISLVKIDTEGHDDKVVAGMMSLIQRDRPVLIIETGSEDIMMRLREVGYRIDRLPGSPNRLCMSS
jgi:FkbM family methyltransferase